MHVLGEFLDIGDEFQSHVTCHSELELSHGVGPLSIEESKELLSVGISLDRVDASIYLVDTSYR